MRDCTNPLDIQSLEIENISMAELLKLTDKLSLQLQHVTDRNRELSPALQVLIFIPSDASESFQNITADIPSVGGCIDGTRVHPGTL